MTFPILYWWCNICQSRLLGILHIICFKLYQAPSPRDRHLWLFLDEESKIRIIEDFALNSDLDQLIALYMLAGSNYFSGPQFLCSQKNNSTYISESFYRDKINNVSKAHIITNWLLLLPKITELVSVQKFFSKNLLIHYGSSIKENLKIVHWVCRNTHDPWRHSDLNSWRFLIID